MGGFYIHNVPQRSTRVQLKLRTFWNSFLFPFYQRCFHPRPCAVHNMPISLCSTLRFWAIRGNRSNYKCRKCLPRLRINMGAICWLDSSERWKALWILAGGPQGQVYAAEEVNTSENLKQNSCLALPAFRDLRKQRGNASENTNLHLWCFLRVGAWP